MTTLSASAPVSAAAADRAGSLSQPVVLAGAFLLTLAALLAGLPILALAFFGAVVGSVFSLLIDHGEDIAAARVSRLNAAGYGWY